MPHWELIEAGPKCSACTPARELLEACRSGQKPPAYSPCSTFQTPCQKLDAYTPGGLCQLGKTCQAGPPKCPAYTPYLTVSLYCHNSNICVWEGSQADKHAGMERKSKLCSAGIKQFHRPRWPTSFHSRLVQSSRMIHMHDDTKCRAH